MKSLRLVWEECVECSGRTNTHMQPFQKDSASIWARERTSVSLEVKYYRGDCCAVFGGSVENSPEKVFESRCQTWFKHLSGENLDCSFDPKHEHPRRWHDSLRLNTLEITVCVCLWWRPACVCGVLVETSFILLTAHVFRGKSFHVCVCLSVCVCVYLYPICG